MFLGVWGRAFGAGIIARSTEPATLRLFFLTPYPAKSMAKGACSLMSGSRVAVSQATGAIAKPEVLYTEAAALKSTRPRGPQRQVFAVGVGPQGAATSCND